MSICALLILIHVLVLLPQLQQLLKHLQPLRLQLPGIHQLLVVLPPRAHVAFLGYELGGFAMVGFHEVDGSLPFGEPEFVLGHIEYAVVVSTLFPRAQCSNGQYFEPMMRFGNYAQDATGGALQVGGYRQIRSQIILLR